MVDKKVIPFSPPDISEAEINEVAEALRSGWITTGPRVKELERRITDYIGVKKACCLNSQTACAEMALRILGIGEGDEVITSAYTYTATASVVCHVGAKLILVDTQPDSLEMDYDAVEKAVSAKTKAIIPVDLAGIPCDYDRIYEIVNRKKSLFQPANDIQKAIGRIVVCSDTAHAFGAKWHGRMVGSIADFSSFSFHAVKNLTTAEGGALTWRTIPGISDEDIYHQLQLFSLHGQSKDALAKTKLGAWEYDIAGTYYKCNMTDIMAAIGQVQLRRYPGLLARRREIVGQYESGLTAINGEYPERRLSWLSHYAGDIVSCGHLFLMRLEGAGPDERERVIEGLAERGVAANVHYKPLPLLTAYKKMGFDIAAFPNAYEMYANEVSLPLHTGLTDGDVAYILESLREVLR